MPVNKKPAKKPADELDDTPIMSSADVDYIEFLEDIGADIAKVMIWRIPRSGDAEWVDTTTLDTVRDFAQLYESYGPGKYRLRFRSADNEWKGSKVVVLAEKKVSGHAPAVNNSGDSSQRTHEILLALIAAQKTPAMPDLGAMMAGIAAIMKPPDMGAMLTAVVMATNTLRGSGDKEDMIAKMRDVMALVNEVRPPSSGEDNVYTVVKDVGEKVVDALAGRPSGNGVTRPAIPPGAQPARQEPAPGALPPAKERTQEEIMKDWIKAQLSYFKAKAKLGKEVEFYIDYVFVNQEEPGCNAILLALEHGATFENLLEFDPEVAQNPELKAWFQKLYDGMCAELTDKSVDSSGATGNTGNPGGNAGSSVA